MTEKPHEPSETPNDPFKLLIQETQNDTNLTDEQKAQKIAALREGQLEASRPPNVQQHTGVELLKLRTPDRDYTPELVAQIAGSLFRGDDYELAVAQALRLLDTSHRLLQRHKMDKASEWKRIPWDKALKEITGVKTPSRAEERLAARLREQGLECVDPEAFKRAIDPQGLGNGSKVQEGHNPLSEPEVEIRRLNDNEIKIAFAYWRENGVTAWQVEQLRQQYLKGAKRARTENLPKKKKKAAKRKKFLNAPTGTNSCSNRHTFSAALMSF
jgi:hypothetical protein